MDRLRLRALVLAVLTSAAVVSPLHPEWRGRNHDSFPLSWYPMFAKDRPEFETPTYTYASGPDGQRAKLHTGWWTPGGFNQGRNMLVQTVTRGAASRAEFCEMLAQKVAKRKGPRWAVLDEVHIVRGTFDRQQFFAEGERAPLSETTLATCPVPR